ncbi:hypothetical protein KSF73_10295 [Burkholderiaceae bacterium DAT-1]|nr:hypothetical protein [Burkholderiaceae bacterium DAT-1]
MLEIEQESQWNNAKKRILPHACILRRTEMVDWMMQGAHQMLKARLQAGFKG